MNDAPPDLSPPPANPPIPLHPHTFRDWIGRHSANDPERTFDELLLALESLNTFILEPGHREALVATIEAVLEDHWPRLEPPLRQRTLPLGARSRQRAEQYARVLEALYRAHVLIIREHELTPARRIDLAAHLQAAGDRLAALGLHHWRLYLPLPEDYWTRVFRLLKRAQTHVATDADWAAPHSRSALSGHSLEALFAGLMILGASTPQALGIGDSDRLARWLGAFPLRGTAIPEPDRHPDLPVIHADLTGNQPPRLLSGADLPVQKGYFIDPAPALERLRNSPESLEPDTLSEHRGIAEQLLCLWSDPSTRRHSRENSQGQRRLCLIGLERINRFLQAELERRMPATPPPSITVLHDEERVSVIQLSKAATDDIGLCLQEPLEGDPPLRPEVHDPRGPGKSETRHTTEATSELPSPDHGRVEDIGAGGLRLRLEQTQQSLVVGELVALLPPESRQWTVGALRWIRCVAPDTLQIGVEYLAARALPVTLQSYRGGRTSGSQRPGLLAVRHGAAGGPVLYMPARAFHREHRIVGWLAGRARILELGSKHTGTPLFTEVGYRISDTPLNPEEQETPQDVLSLAPEVSRLPPKGQS